MAGDAEAMAMEAGASLAGVMASLAVGVVASPAVVEDLLAEEVAEVVAKALGW
jgi:hypothetical protein